MWLEAVLYADDMQHVKHTALLNLRPIYSSLNISAILKFITHHTTNEGNDDSLLSILKTLYILLLGLRVGYDVVNELFRCIPSLQNMKEKKITKPLL